MSRHVIKPPRRRAPPSTLGQSTYQAAAPAYTPTPRAAPRPPDQPRALHPYRARAPPRRAGGRTCAAARGAPRRGPQAAQAQACAQNARGDPVARRAVGMGGPWATGRSRWRAGGAGGCGYCRGLRERAVRVDLTSRAVRRSSTRGVVMAHARARAGRASPATRRTPQTAMLCAHGGNPRLLNRAISRRNLPPRLQHGERSALVEGGDGAHEGRVAGMAGPARTAALA